MVSASLGSVVRAGGFRQLSVIIASACLTAGMVESSARGAPSDTLQITYADGTPVVAGNGISVDYKIGPAATVTLQNGQTLGPLDLPEPALETTDEGRVIVNINGYLTVNPDIMVGLGSRSAYLLEPDLPAAFSDIMQCVTRQNLSNPLHRDFEFTLISTPDPALASANPLPGDLVITESGFPQDVSTGLFSATPNSNQTRAPFHVFVTSDVDVPEPGTRAIGALAGVAVLAGYCLGGRKGRQAGLP
jgi:hypothetical protein